MLGSNAAGAVFAAIVILSMAIGNAYSQGPLVDYESSAGAAQVRADAGWRLAFRPPLQVVRQTVGQLRNARGLDARVQVEADELIQKAESESEADARRSLWRAATLLNGHSWSPDHEQFGALALRTRTPVWTGAGDELSVEALYTPSSSAGSLTYSLDLLRAEPTTSATPRRGALVKALSRGDLAGAYPQYLVADVNGVPDGAYLLFGRIGARSGANTELALSVYVLHDLETRHAALRATLRGVRGHVEAVSIAEYPYALAQSLKAGRREIISYDFPAAMVRSRRIVDALAAGRDDVRRAKGLQNRAYRFEETGELIPYQLYVPAAWKVDRKWPLVVALHGANLDETNMLGRDNGRMQALAEQHGFVVVAPLGYRLNSAYGSQRGFSTAIVGADAERRRRSEQDVLSVMALVEREYNIDRSRRYLTGNSMGGGGTWWIGGRYPDRWAALAPVAYGGVLQEDVPGLRRVPLMVVVGDRDDLMLERVRASVATLRSGGVTPRYVEVPGGTHSSAFETALPDIFQFFANAIRCDRRAGCPS